MGLLEDSKFVGAKFFLSQWKAYDSIASIEEFAKRLIKNPYFGSHVCLLAVPFAFLNELSKKITHPNIVLGANAMHSSLPGTFSASISGLLLKRNQARFVLIGSNESRTIHGNDSMDYKSQIKSALESQITPFYCIGETLAQHQEGQARQVLLQQCEEGLSGLSHQDLSQLCVVYEAPWLKSTPEKLSLDKLATQYEAFKHAVRESVEESDFQNLKIINALPLDLEVTDELLKIIPDKGLYAVIPEIFFSFLNEKSAEKLKVEETAYTPKPHKTEPEKLVKDERYLEATGERASNLVEAKTEEEEKEAITQAKQKEAEKELADEEEFAAAEQEEETALEDALKNAREMQPLSEGKIEKEMDHEEEALSLELVADEEDGAAPLGSQPEEVAYQPVEEFTPKPSKAAASAALSPSTDEEALASTSSGDYPMSILENQSSEQGQEPQELQELQMKLQHLQSLDKSLGDCYHQINEKMEALPSLRENFPLLLNKMTADLNQLDPALQEQINRGNIAFFTENPDKMKEAAGVLLQIQEINLLLQKTAAIPREVDRILSKSREIRKALEAEWSYFQISRHRIKENHPNFPYPLIPSQLMIPEPKTDITPTDFGPSNLVSKRIAVVKAPPLPT
jgi:triosephosphate isomerase (TIM)